MYLFFSLYLQMMVDTVNLLMFGCTLCPASLVLIPWTRTRSITVYLMTSDILCSLSLLSTSTSPHMNSSSQISRAWHTRALWTGLLYTFSHIISHKCDHFWVVVFKWWHLCVLSCLTFVTCAHFYATRVHHNENVVSKKVRKCWWFSQRNNWFNIVQTIGFSVLAVEKNCRFSIYVGILKWILLFMFVLLNKKIIKAVKYFLCTSL